MDDILSYSCRFGYTLFNIEYHRVTHILVQSYVKYLFISRTSSNVDVIQAIASTIYCRAITPQNWNLHWHSTETTSENNIYDSTLILSSATAIHGTLIDYYGTTVLGKQVMDLFLSPSISPGQ